MNRLTLRLASLLLLLLAGCASYGPYYGERRAVWQDGGYYVAADRQYGDYYYGAPRVEYRYLDSWSSYGFWRMDRYRCGFYGDCWRYRGGSHWSPFAPSWSYWHGSPSGWSFSIAPSWYYGRWGWHDRHQGHDRHYRHYRHDGSRRDRPRHDAAERPLPTAPRAREPGYFPSRPEERAILPVRPRSRSELQPPSPRQPRNDIELERRDRAPRRLDDIEP